MGIDEYLGNLTDSPRLGSTPQMRNSLVSILEF